MKKIRLFLSIFLPIQIFVVYFLKDYPLFVEKVYSTNLYPFLRILQTRIFSFFPFSVGDIMYILMIVYLVFYVFGIIKRKFRLKKSDFYKIVSFVSIVYFLFHFFWGFNYYRLPLHKQLKIGSDYTTEELLDFTKLVVQKTNTLHTSLTTNDSLAVQYSQSIEDYEDIAFQNFEDVTFLGHTVEYQSIKPSLLSLPLSYMGFGGYINPFSLESQYNSKVPKSKLPTLITHEMAHQLGYAKENEANFVSCYLTMHSKNRRIQYAGYAYALKFCLREMYKRAPDQFEGLKSSVNHGVLENYKEVSLFWQQYKNPLEPVFKKTYGNFLKVNNQPKGMGSYNYVVALLVNYFTEKNLP